MTAEVAVLNRVGVALAADSAVTIGREATKIYTSSDKLFQLSCSAPMGVMIYGSATFLGIPWETIIKVYRDRLGTTRYDTSKEYAKKFISFLVRNERLFPKAVQREHERLLVRRLFLNIRAQLRKAFDKEAQERDGLKDADIPEIADVVIKKRLEEIRGRDRLKGLTKSPATNVRKQLAGMINEEKRLTFGELPLSAGSEKDLTSAAVDMLTREYFGPFISGIVVSGFGEQEYMPAVHAFAIEESILGRPRFVDQGSEYIREEMSATIRTYAQGETVRTFLEGIDLSLEESMISSTQHLFTGVMSSIAEKVGEIDTALGESLRNILDKEVPGLLKELFAQWEEWRRELWGPVVGVASTLPKDELAGMAEALVNLTKFRRRVTPERETVGGPIDVAVITKGDGFVWVKRKHYFSPELNPRIMARFNQEA